MFVFLALIVSVLVHDLQASSLDVQEMCNISDSLPRTNWIYNKTFTTVHWNYRRMMIGVIPNYAFHSYSDVTVSILHKTVP